jgi:hypothetical protein
MNSGNNRAAAKNSRARTVYSWAKHKIGKTYQLYGLPPALESPVRDSNNNSEVNVDMNHAFRRVSAPARLVKTSPAIWATVTPSELSEPSGAEHHLTAVRRDRSLRAHQQTRPPPTQPDELAVK